MKRVLQTRDFAVLLIALPPVIAMRYAAAFVHRRWLV